MNNSMQSSQAANAGSTSESDPPLRTKELATGLFEFHAEDNTTSQSKREAEATTYMSGFKLVVVLVALCLANFLVALDTTILSTAIPVISDEFHSLPDVGWYVSAYFLTNCAFQLLNGKLYTLFDFKIVFVGAMIVFEIGSLLCAVAPNSEVFILGRAIAGLGSAGIFSGG